MLSEEESRIIRKIISSSLESAESHWESGGYKLLQEASVFDSINMSAESEKSHIPGHSIVHEKETVISEFIALVADMRGSSNHLMQAISAKKAKVSCLQRVYYETTALLPAIAQTIKFKNGKVTEYLGDGVLALYPVDPYNKSEAVYDAYNASKNIIGDTRNLINEILYEKYSLPEVNLGVGLALSKTLVTLIGLKGEKHPKAFGECVFRATKLSNGVNEIYTDKNLRSIWPSSDGGKILFKQKKFSGFDGYLVGTGQ